jgi:hypothetical protein
MGASFAHRTFQAQRLGSPFLAAGGGVVATRRRRAGKRECGQYHRPAIFASRAHRQPCIPPFRVLLVRGSNIFRAAHAGPMSCKSSRAQHRGRQSRPQEVDLVSRLPSRLRLRTQADHSRSKGSRSLAHSIHRQGGEFSDGNLASDANHPFGSRRGVARAAQPAMAHTFGNCPPLSPASCSFVAAEHQ